MANTEIPPKTRSEIAEAILRLEGKPYSLHNGYELYIPIFDCQHTSLVLINARQTGKSQYVSCRIALDAAITPYHKALYVSPSQAQTLRFSHSKLMKLINGSPIPKKLFSAGDVNNTLTKIAANGSEINLSYADQDADRIRGITTDDTFYDEVQDCEIATVLPVVDACSSASLNPTRVFSGTPKSVENGLEDLWQRSTKYEALIRCDGCNKWNVPSVANIGKKGFICKKCGKLLNVRNFKWHAFNPGARATGFHIPQIILPMHTEIPVKWDNILEAYETYPQNKFNNEIMAISDSVGTRLVTKDDLLNLCREYNMSMTPTAALMKETSTTICGVDWGGNGKDGISRTVMHIWGATPNLTLKTLYYRVFSVEDPVSSVQTIAQICNAFQVRLVIGDNGEGSLANGILMNMLGKHRVARAKYGSFAKALEIDNDTGVYHLDKTIVIDNYFKFLKEGAAIFPTEGESNTAFDDMLNEFTEVTSTGRKIWTHSMSRPDDCLHAQVFGWIAHKLLSRDLTFF